MLTDIQREAICSQVVRILRKERLKAHLSMLVLSQRAGLSQAMISLVERDLRNPTLDTLLRVSSALDLDFAKVFKQAQTAALKPKSA